jgi:RNA polymerase sigma-70 factor (ECF subfamily)
MVLQAGEAGGELSRQALAELCEAYWFPVYGYLRGQGHREQDARDLTQAYFTELLEKRFLEGLRPDAGRFRSFLLVSLRNFLSHQRDHERALKRGGGVQPVDLDSARAEVQLAAEGGSGQSPEQAFEVRWARTVVRRSVERLESEFADAGQAERFTLLRGFLIDDGPTRPYAEIAGRLEVTENAVKTMVRRLRHRFGIVIRAEVAHTLSDHEDVDVELRHLLQVLENR